MVSLSSIDQKPPSLFCTRRALCPEDVSPNVQAQPSAHVLERPACGRRGQTPKTQVVLYVEGAARVGVGGPPPASVWKQETPAL